MRTLKPQRLGVLTRPFEHDGRCHLVVTVLVGFRFAEPDVPIHEAALWQAVTSALPEGSALDEAMAKPRGEVLVTGAAYPPLGEPAIGCAVEVRLGPIHKRLYVVGDRRWETTGPSDPEPFTRMPVTWARAFGGESHAENPFGRGVGAVTDRDGHKRVPLPNIEDPDALLRARGDRPTPVGLAPIDVRSAVRQRRSGTYDKRWLASVFPGLPADFDLALFNVAPEDQWLPDFFAGGEPFVLTHLHPTRPRLEGRVPRLRARAFLEQDGHDELVELATRLDTVHLFPDLELGVAFYRAVTEVAEDDARDVRALMLACEHLDAAKPLEHYEGVMRLRLDRTASPLHHLDDRQLLPALPEGRETTGLSEVSPLPELFKREQRLEKNLRQRALVELENLREICKKHDVDPDLHLPRDLPPATDEPPDLDHLAEYVEQQQAEAERARVDAERRREELLSQARALCEAQGIDFDALVAAGRADGGGPPKFRAVDELDKLHEMRRLSENTGVALPMVEQRLADPALFTQLLAAEQQLLAAYRQNAHVLPPAPRRDETASQTLAVRLTALVETGESVDGADFTGADLAGLSLEGASLRGVFFEGSVLRGANLRDADLTDAVLVRADLTDADLGGAKLRGANLAEATLARTVLAGSDLTAANLTGARLEGARLDGAHLDRAFLFGAVIEGGSFVGIHAEALFFHGLDLTAIDLSGAELPRCIFVDTRLRDASLRGARLEGACFVTVDADGASFADAQCHNLRVVHGSSLVGVSFENAALSGANLRDTPMAGANLARALAPGIDLSGCDLAGATLDGLRAPGALLVRTNLAGATLVRSDLMQAILQKANLNGADFTGANLFRCDFAKIVGDRETCFEGANMKFIRFVDRERGGDEPD